MGWSIHEKHDIRQEAKLKWFCCIWVLVAGGLVHTWKAGHTARITMNIIFGVSEYYISHGNQCKFTSCAWIYLIFEPMKSWSIHEKLRIRRKTKIIIFWSDLESRDHATQLNIEFRCGRKLWCSLGGWMTYDKKQNEFNFRRILNLEIMPHNWILSSDAAETMM